MAMRQHALVIDGTIEAVGHLPQSARRLDTDEWVMGLRNADVSLQQACGYYEVQNTSRPPDTDTTTYDRSVELVDGTPTVVWTQRAKTADEQQAEQQSTTEDAIRQAVRDHLATLRQIRGSSGQLNNAQLSQSVRALARGQVRVIRLLVNELDGTD